MSTVDVVVVGGRVAGASTALLLARAGLSVALVDRGRRGSDTLSTHALMRAGVLQLSRWGVLDGVVAAGTPAIRRTVFHHADGEDVAVAIRPRAGVDALYAPRRHLLDRLLVEAAEDAGVRVLHETTVTSLRRDPDGPGQRGGRPHQQRHPVDLAARLTVGADGLRSVVAEEVGATRHVARPHRERGALPLRRGRPARRLRVGLRRRRRRGGHPDQRRRVLPVRVDHPVRMRRLRRLGVERAIAELLAAAGPAAVERVRDRAPLSPVRGWAGVPGFARRSWGPGLGAGRRRGLLQGPDHLPRHHRRAARRRAARRAGAWPRGAATYPRTVALADYQTDPRPTLARALRRRPSGWRRTTGTPTASAACSTG